MLTFAQLLQQHIDTAGLSLYELAKRSGVGRGTLHNFLSGRRSNPGIEIVGKVAAGLGVHPATLIPPGLTPLQERALRKLAGVSGQMAQGQALAALLADVLAGRA